MDTNIVNNRKKWLDIARGFGIILIIILHTAYLEVNDWIATVSLPLFFLISGNTFSTKCNFSHFFIRKVQSLLIPYFSIGIICFMFSFLLDSVHGNVISLSYSVNYYFSRLLLQVRFTPLWFVACLFVLEIICYPIIKAVKKPLCLFTIGLVGYFAGVLYYKLGGVSLPWNIDVCLPALFYFITGYLFKLYFCKVRSAVTHIHFAIRVCASFAISVICIIINKSSSAGFSNMFLSNYCYPVVTLIGAISGISFIIELSIALENLPYNFVSYIGKNSFIYYSTHATIVIPIAKTILHRLNILVAQPTHIHVIIYTVYILIIVLILTTIANHFLLKTPLKFIVGK